jgi:hypothetical protein
MARQQILSEADMTPEIRVCARARQCGGEREKKHAAGECGCGHLVGGDFVRKAAAE